MAQSIETQSNSGSTPIHKLPNSNSVNMNTFGTPGSLGQGGGGRQEYHTQQNQPQYSHQLQPQQQPQTQQQSQFSSMTPNDQNIQINIHEPSVQPRALPNTTMNQTQHTQNQPNSIPDHQMQSIMSAIHGNGQGFSQGQLPSRDIPMSQQMLLQDEAALANYVPGQMGPEQEGNTPHTVKRAKSVRFVEEANEKMKVKEENAKVTRRQIVMVDEILDAIHVPIILALLFVVFQMPSINTKLYGFMPSLFLKEGKLSLGGMATKGVLFAGLYVVINQVILYLSTL